ncbi:MAG: serpin family protein [Clostridia bacterium]|nr:serpin family protein [Clostridia bacterium]
MKRLLCILFAMLLLCACTVTGTPAAPVAEPTVPTEAPETLPDVPIPEITGYAGFSDVLSSKLLDGTQNKNLSPISVYLALAMTAEGASGETQADMLKLLGCSSLEELRGVCGAMLETLSFDTEDSTLEIADSIWMADRNGTLTFREDYLKTLADVYRSEANAVDFAKAETGKQIAAWITEHTRGKITLSPDDFRFDPDTVAVLINTIYLKDAWRDAFYEGATQSGTFHGLSGDLTVDYMHRTDNDVMIIKGDGFLSYSLPLLRVGRMTFILPDEGTPLSDLFGTPEKLDALLNDGMPIRADVDVKLPKFKFEDRIELNEILESLGLGRAFDPDRADFSGMCVDKNDIFISKVLQGSFIGVDENGVEAAAYTMIVMAEGCALYPEDLPKIDFHLTRPFLYTIESDDGTVLFIGTVTEPTNAE